MLKDIIVNRRPLGANFTEMNHFGMAYLKAPEKFDGLAMQVFATKVYSNTPLTALYGISKRTVSEDVYEWDLNDVPGKPSVVVETLTTGTAIGQYHQPITVVLDTNIIKKGEYIAPNGNTDKQLRCIDGPEPYGTGYKYSFVLADDDELAYIDSRYIAVGARFNVLYAKYGEMSSHAGGVQFGSMLHMKNRLSRQRYEYKVSGDIVENDALTITLVDENGNKYNTWIKYAEAVYWNKIFQAYERDLWFSRSTETIVDENGRPVNSGAGLHEQIEDGGWVTNYSNLTASLIEEFIMDIFFGRMAPQGKRTIRAFTGQYGMRAFHNAMVDWLNIQPSSFYYDGVAMQPATSPYHDNAYSVGYRIVKWMMPNGAEIELIHNPLYDDPNGEVDPITGIPVNSMRITFFDVTNGEGGSNIEIVEKQNAKKFKYINGMSSPFGNDQTAAHSGDWYTMVYQNKSGIILKDPTRSGMLIFNV